MPTLVWHYLTALLYDRTSTSCVALAEALKTVSHDRLTRLLQADWSGQILLEFGCAHVVRQSTRDISSLMTRSVPNRLPRLWRILPGYIPARSAGPFLASRWCCWSGRMGACRIPLGVRLWRKGGPSKYALALALLSYARNRLHCHPDFVLFDAWYPSKALLKRLRDYGWYVVCRLKKNRCFNGHAVRHHRRHPDWAEAGRRSGGLKVLVVRYGAQYDATNRLTLSAVEVRRRYRVRAQIEEVIRACKDQLGLGGCQARSQRAQPHHLTCCLVAFCVLERESQDRGLSNYQLKRHLRFQGPSMPLPALERLRNTA